MQGAKDRSSAWAETGVGPGLFSRYRTALNFGFFDVPTINSPNVNGAKSLGITAEQFQALILLHEVRHYLCPHCAYAEKHEDWNEDIVKYCFK